jgi:hypothetical protein
MTKRKLIIFLMIFIILLIALNNPLMLLNCKYESRGFIDTIEPKLYVVTHNYEHIDVLIMLEEVKKSNELFTFIFADKWHNKLLELISDNKIEFLYVTGGTTDKMINRLKNKRNIVIFLYPNNKNTGVYHVLKAVNVPVILTQIKSDISIINHEISNNFDMLVQSFGQRFSVSYEIFNYNINHLLMNQLIKKLYE